MNRKERRKITAEDFTPMFMADDMIDNLLSVNPDILLPEYTCLDPCCGNGNLLVSLLKRRIKHGYDPTESIKSIYGCDIIESNISEAKQRLKELCSDDVDDILDNNIVFVDLNEYERGSLSLLSVE